MSALPKYAQGDQGRFSFRIANGLGSFCEPDPEDPDLRVEFYDGEGDLRFTATSTSSPPLSTDEDGQGVFLYIEEIELAGFALGTCDAWVYAQIAGEPVLPYPTILEAFEVVTGAGSEPAYSLVSKVRAELPSQLPTELTDAVIEQYLSDAGRRIDAALADCYATPFPGVEEMPATPALIERLCRKLAVADCLVFLGAANALELSPALEARALAELERLRKGELTLEGYAPSRSIYQGSLYQEEYPGEVLE